MRTLTGNPLTPARLSGCVGYRSRAGRLVVHGGWRRVIAARASPCHSAMQAATRFNELGRSDSPPVQPAGRSARAVGDEVAERLHRALGLARRATAPAGPAPPRHRYAPSRAPVSCRRLAQQRQRLGVQLVVGDRAGREHLPQAHRGRVGVVAGQRVEHRQCRHALAQVGAGRLARLAVSDAMSSRSSESWNAMPIVSP